MDNIFVSSSAIQQEIGLLLSKLITEDNIQNYIAYLPNNKYGSETNNILKAKLKAKEENLIKSDFYTANDPLFDKKLISLLESYKVSDEYM